MAKTTTKSMTSGNILKLVVTFALPLMLGNLFQMFYNTVDSIIVGRFVSKQALAAVGSTTMLSNMAIFFFNGFSIGAGVVVSRAFGAKDMDKLHTAVETTMATTFVLSVIFSIVGVLAVRPLLHFMATPDDVFEDAVTYLQIYLGGISGLLIYNMCSGILRAVGDSTRPLLFLMLTSVMNVILDLVFVVAFKLGIAGVALATIVSQFISAFLTLTLLTRTKDIYKLTWHDLKIDFPTLRSIFAVGLPAAIQSILTAFSNIFVQSYINYFGSSVMAGWAAYNKLDQFVMLPQQSMAMAATTFVSQNMGAKQEKRALQGLFTSLGVALCITGTAAVTLMIFAPATVAWFTTDEEVIHYGSLFLRSNLLFMLINCCSHVTAGALRGKGDSKGPMIIMLANYVGVRQIYLFVMTNFILNIPFTVGISYPVGWTCNFLTFVVYTYFTWIRKLKRQHLTA